MGRGMTIYVRLADARGLKAHDPVMYRGMEIGRVSSVSFDDDGVLVDAHIEAKYCDRMREGVVVYVYDENIFFNRKVLHVAVPDENAPLLADGATLAGVVRPDEKERLMRLFAKDLVGEATSRLKVEIIGDLDNRIEHLGNTIATRAVSELKEKVIGDVDKRLKDFGEHMAKKAVKALKDEVWKTPGQEPETTEPVVENTDIGNLRIVLHGASIHETKTSGSDWDAGGGAPDCYAEVFANGVRVLCTETEDDTLSPKWHAASRGFACDSATEIKVCVWDSDSIKDDCVGRGGPLKVSAADAKSKRKINISFGRVRSLIFHVETCE
jgi:hypothetical protein